MEEQNTKIERTLQDNNQGHQIVSADTQGPSSGFQASADDQNENRPSGGSKNQGSAEIEESKTPKGLDEHTGTDNASGNQ